MASTFVQHYQANVKELETFTHGYRGVSSNCRVPSSFQVVVNLKGSSFVEYSKYRMFDYLIFNSPSFICATKI